MSRKAFTLIELLIVVAIIAILAAIAVPNFLEAQTRSKVSRVQADFRTLATAIESYYVDKNSYPWDQDDDITSTGEDGFRLLTTPISYFSSGRALSDPFADERRPGNNDSAPHYQMSSGVDPYRRGTDRIPRGDPAYEPVQAWALFSNGPNNRIRGPAESVAMSNDDWPFKPIGGGVNLNPRAFYDPTNGTTSFGTIIRFGGDYNGGNWVIAGDENVPDLASGIPHELWGVKASYP
jgi:prepilin-type N-terminal cleavage/methylation domain-containing protein